MKRGLVAAAVALLVAGCGGDSTVETTTTATTPVETTAVRVYWLRDGRVWPVRRDVQKTMAVANAALLQLFGGPTEQERADLGVDTAVVLNDRSQLWSVSIVDGTALVHSDPPSELSPEALAQLVYTLTQFAAVKRVAFGDKTYTRADFEDYTPAILVESPLPFEEVGSPLRVTGTANTFEANFSYELTDTDGLIVDENFVTATSGTGTRGTFDFTTKPYAVKFDGIGALIVFERSAKDGSKINLVEIPLRMTR